MSYPQNGDRIVAIGSVTSRHAMYLPLPSSYATDALDADRRAAVGGRPG